MIRYANNLNGIFFDKIPIAKIFLILMVLSVIITLACSDEDSCNPKKISINEITGYVQKGPFMVGSTIQISELNSHLKPTGRTFNTQIENNTGFFSLGSVELESQYVELKADGFYYNEVLGENSNSQITLYSIVDLSDSASVNVNCLSHIERNRVKNLTNEGLSFNEAKQQAFKEILGNFLIESLEYTRPEFLDISKDGDVNAALLCISSILQGFRTESELSELLTNIALDLESDGTIEYILGTTLINQSIYLNPQSIKKNIENRYTELGIDVTVPDFEPYLNNFNINADFELTNSISYPEQGIYGQNLLKLDSIDVSSFDELSPPLSVAVYLPKGHSINITYSYPINNRNYFMLNTSGNYPPIGIDTKSEWNSGQDSLIVILDAVGNNEIVDIAASYREDNPESTEPFELIFYITGDNLIYNTGVKRIVAYQ